MKTDIRVRDPFERLKSRGGSGIVGRIMQLRREALLRAYRKASRTAKKLFN